MNSKNLHIHALPIVVLAITASVLSCSFLLARNHVSGMAVLDSWKTPAVSLHAKSDGLASVLFGHDTGPLVRSEHPAEQATVIFQLQQ